MSAHPGASLLWLFGSLVPRLLHWKRSLGTRLAIWTVLKEFERSTVPSVVHLWRKVKIKIYKGWICITQPANEIAFARFTTLAVQSVACHHNLSFQGWRLKVNPRPTLTQGRLKADSRPTQGQRWLKADSRPTQGQLKANSRPTQGQLKANSRPTQGQLKVANNNVDVYCSFNALANSRAMSRSFTRVWYVCNH